VRFSLVFLWNGSVALLALEMPVYIHIGHHVKCPLYLLCCYLALIVYHLNAGFAVHAILFYCFLLIVGSSWKIIKE